MQLSDEQLRAILEMGDITGAEQDLARQQAVATQLRRTAMEPAGRHWTAQAARALQGIGSAYGQYAGDKRALEIGEMRRAIPRAFMPRRPTTPTAGLSPEDEQYSVYG